MYNRAMEHTYFPLLTHEKKIVFKLFPGSGDLIGGSPSTSVTVYTKHVHVMSAQQR